VVVVSVKSKGWSLEKTSSVVAAAVVSLGQT